MKFAVRDIKANPFRHVERYPIRRDKVEALRESIRTTSFWDNVVAREVNGKAEIAYGHHRLVALKEELGPSHKVDLIIRKLDDDTMLQIMARDNIEEWGTAASVEHETIRAVVEAYADGKITLPGPSRTARASWRYAPSFIIGQENASARTTRPYTAREVAEFIGWITPKGETSDKVHNALASLQLIEEGILSEDEFDGLTTKQAEAVLREATRARRRREAVAEMEARKAEAAEQAAKVAEEQREQAQRRAEARKAEQEQARSRAEAKKAEQKQARSRAEARKAEQERAKSLAEAKKAEQESAMCRAEAKKAEQERERALTQARQARAKVKSTQKKGTAAAKKVGRAVSKTIRSGKAGYREAAAVARKADKDAPITPVMLNDLAEQVATDLGKILDPERDARRVEKFSALVHYADEISDRSRRNVVVMLEELVRRVEDYRVKLTGKKRQLAVGRRH